MNAADRVASGFNIGAVKNVSIYHAGGPIKGVEEKGEMLLQSGKRRPESPGAINMIGIFLVESKKKMRDVLVGTTYRIGFPGNNDVGHNFTQFCL